MRTRRTFVLGCALSALCPGAANAQAPEPEVERVDRATQAVLDEAVHRGRLIYEYDLAAAVSSDEMRRLMTQEQINPSRGWVIEPIETGLRVTYYGLEGDTPYAVAVFDVNGRSVSRSEISDPGARPPLSELGRRMAFARTLALDTAREADYGLCAGPIPHTVVFPPDGQETISVYILTPQNDPDIYPVGGHYRVDVTRTNSVTHRRFLRTCFAYDATPSAEGREPVGFVVSHSLDPTPTEIHVLVAHWTGTLMHVLTTQNRRVWRVAHDAIEFTDTMAQTDSSSERDPEQ